MIDLNQFIVLQLFWYRWDVTNDGGNQGLLTSEEESSTLDGESNNIEQDNEGELENEFEVYNYEED